MALGCRDFAGSAVPGLCRRRFVQAAYSQRKSAGIRQRPGNGISAWVASFLHLLMALAQPSFSRQATARPHMIHTPHHTIPHSSHSTSLHTAPHASRQSLSSPARASRCFHCPPYLHRRQQKKSRTRLGAALGVSIRMDAVNYLRRNLRGFTMFSGRRMVSSSSLLISLCSSTRSYTPRPLVRASLASIVEVS